MKIYEGMVSVRDARCSIVCAELGTILDRRIEELSVYPDFDAAAFVKLIVLDPGDTLLALNEALGFELLERNCDVIESHHGWFELTFVLSDDGAGVVTFIPKTSGVDSSLGQYCHRQMALLSP